MQMQVQIWLRRFQCETHLTTNLQCKVKYKLEIQKYYKEYKC
jgi:hypothetical protein